MKRTFKSKPKFPFRMRSSGIHGEFRPKSPLGASTTSSDKGRKRVRRALFPITESNNLHNLKLDAASIQSEAAKAPTSAADAPKTSEYAYFKKMKESVCNNSYLLHNDTKQLKNDELRDCSRETPCKRSRSNYVRSSSLPVETTHPETCYSIESLPCDGSRNPEVNDVPVLGCMNAEKVKPVDHRLSPPPADSKLKYPVSKKVLPGNRKKLQQWVGNTSLHEVDELCSNSDSMPWKTETSTSFSESGTIDEGHPIEAISWIEPDHRSYMDDYISRWPMENGHCSNPMPWRVEIDTKYELPLFPEPNTPVRSRQARRRKLIETEPLSYMDDYFSSLPLENTCGSDSMSWKVETDTKYELAPFSEPNKPITDHQTQRRKFVEPEHWSYLDDYSPRRIIGNSGHADPMLWQVEISNKEELPAFNNLDALLNRHQIHGIGSNESDHSSFLNGLFSRWSCGYRDTDLLEWGTIGLDSSYFSDNAKVHNHVRFSESHGCTDGRRIRSLFSENRTFDEYPQTHPSGHLKGTYIWQVDDESRLIGGSRPLLLEWECKDEEDETDMPALDSLVEMNTVTTSPNRPICSPPFSNRYSDVTLLAHYSLADGHHSSNDAPLFLQNNCQNSFLLRNDDDENLEYCLNGRNHLLGHRMTYQSWSLNDFDTCLDQGIDQMGYHLLLPTSTVDNYEERLYLDKYSSDEC